MTYQVFKSPSDLNSNAWDQLAHPSLYLSSGWLRARSRIVKSPARFILTSGTDGRPLASAPCYLASDNAHPGYVPARLLSLECLPDADYLSSSRDLDAIAGVRSVPRF